MFPFYQLSDVVCASASDAMIHQLPLGGTMLTDMSLRYTVVEQSLSALPKRIVVMCNGRATGDSACRLAADLAAVTGASVRAVAVLQPAQIARMAAVSVDDPVETLLTGVTQQLYRATPLPGLWCMTLLVGALAGQLEQACRDNTADLLILPESECGEAAAVTIGTRAVVTVLCVAATAEIVGSMVGSQSTARVSTQRSAQSVSPTRVSSVSAGR